MGHWQVYPRKKENLQPQRTRIQVRKNAALQYEEGAAEEREDRQQLTRCTGHKRRAPAMSLDMEHRALPRSRPEMEVAESAAWESEEGRARWGEDGFHLTGQSRGTQAMRPKINNGTLAGLPPQKEELCSRRQAGRCVTV